MKYIVYIHTSTQKKKNRKKRKQKNNEVTKKNIQGKKNKKKKYLPPTNFEPVSLRVIDTPSQTTDALPIELFSPMLSTGIFYIHINQPVTR